MIASIPNSLRLLILCPQANKQTNRQTKLTDRAITLHHCTCTHWKKYTV